MAAEPLIKKITKVAIVTPVHNRRAITLQCLQSLSEIRRDGLDVSIYVVDDGSTDGTAEAIEREHPNVHVIAGDGNLWFTEGTNVGVRRALEDAPDYVLMINDDTVFHPDFLVHLVDTATTQAPCAVGALLLLWDRPEQVFQVSPRWDEWAGGWRHWRHQTIHTVPTKPWRVDLIVGNCVLVPAAAFHQHGLMNSKRYPNFGDAEFTPRLRKAGWTLLVDPRAHALCQPNDLPPRVRAMKLRDKLNVLVFDLGHIHNLRRRFYSCVDGAPSRLKGCLAFAVFFARWAIGRNLEGPWADRLDEPPLRESQADAVVCTQVPMNSTSSEPAT